jgi:hypothetical protein
VYSSLITNIQNTINEDSTVDCEVTIRLNRMPKTPKTPKTPDEVKELITDDYLKSLGVPELRTILKKYYPEKLI